MATPFATPRARALGFGLRTWREARGLGVRQLARMIGVHGQEVSSWEYGKRTPRLDQVALLLGALVVEPRERDRLLELAGNLAEPNWLDTSGAAAYVQYEREASAVFGWEPLLVPGLLQTPAYTRTVLAGLGVTGAEAEELVTVRQLRQGLLTGPEPLPFRAVVAEAVLRPKFLDPPDLAAQLDLLLALGRRANVSLRVLPDGPACHPGLGGPLAILEFAQLPPIVFLEHYRAGGYLYAEEDVRHYRAAAERLTSLAWSEADTAELIAALRVSAARASTG